ncbi:ABC transporter ATP-binding protein [Kineosporia rhizophila]|uniref:ABC transporter ATP-binding protein n=1 Tax=Kineosporia rhizophila TaxID=84633 RepID=UPI0038CC1986
MSPLTSLLSVRDLRTAFNGQTVVDGVDLDLQPGRTLGLVGESGSGKSVTALSVMGLLDRGGQVLPGSSIRLEGRELAGLGERGLREVRGRRMAMIFQEPMSSLNPVYTVGDQVAETVRRHRGLSRRAARERAVELLRLVGISAPERRVTEYPHQLSGGMRQRVMIAIAISADPAVLIADEPTTALDVTIQGQILTLLKELQERLNMAILMITHDLGVVSQIADDVAVMYAGQVIERTETQRLVGNPAHPYSRGLLASVPRLGMDRNVPLPSIPGSVPSPADWPAGCRFADRCEFVTPGCREKPPLLLERWPGHEVACDHPLVDGVPVPNSSREVVS